MSKGAQERRRKKRQAAPAGMKESQAGPSGLTASANQSPTNFKTYLPQSKLGPPGIPQEIHAVAVREGEQPSEESDRARLSDDSEREFKVVVHLGTDPAPFASENIAISLDPELGASLLRASPDAVEMRFNTTFGVVAARLNSQKEYASLEFGCRTKGRLDALKTYSQYVAPLVDHISFEADVPIFVRSIVWFDTKNHVLGASYVPPFRHVQLRDMDRIVDREMEPFYALYREGITASSVFYQFMCYMKVLEGVFRWFVPKARQDFRRAGQEFPKLDVRVPDHAEFVGGVRDWIGVSVEKTFNDYLQPKFRNAIAHFAADGEAPIVVSSYLSSSDVAENTYVARWCARAMISVVADVVRGAKTKGT